jgi:hypothetical protein
MVMIISCYLMTVGFNGRGATLRTDASNDKRNPSPCTLFLPFHTHSRFKLLTPLLAIGIVLRWILCFFLLLSSSKTVFGHELEVDNPSQFFRGHQQLKKMLTLRTLDRIYSRCRLKGGV